MIRELLKKNYVGMNREFRFRGEEPGIPVMFIHGKMVTRNRNRLISQRNEPGISDNPD